MIEEHVRAGVLRANGYEPRHRVLLSGPPGNGKTSFGEAIAEALALPFFVVRYDALIGLWCKFSRREARKGRTCAPGHAASTAFQISGVR